MAVNKVRLGKRFTAVVLALFLLIGLFPQPYTFAASEAVTFSSGAVVLDSSYSGKNIIIENGVFSVTVKGATDVNIIFNGVTIDRRYSSDAATGGLNGSSDIVNKVTGDDLYAASVSLGWNSTGTGTAPVCPFLVTGNSSVTAAFRGVCTFYAGTNGCTVDSDGTYYASQTGAGFAGIQVDSGSSLTIAYAEDLTVYGAHQLAVPDENGQVSGQDYSDVLRANATITAAGYTDPWAGTPYKTPTGATNNQQSGGAGIGGGAAYNTTNAGTSDYTSGTPGTIIINSGNIEAFGGHQAAGIGGGVNGAATSDKIVINGGTVVAHGGRWSAGIGDGDSTPNDGYTNTSTTYKNSSLIEINGGTVTAYGGVGSPGIGCSDGLEAVGMESGMEILVNGGSVNAFSGFPDKFAGTYGTVAPAAIGAGAGSTMDSNSIYVSSSASLSCAGFGSYALTEDGTDADWIPIINLDSDGYLLLLRTGQYFSSSERMLDLYLPQRVSNPNTGVECIVYVEQATGKLYYLDQGHSLVYDDSFTELSEADVPENLTLYVDENSQKIDSIELAYYFRSIALTLPNPALYGGLYALTAPVKGISNVTDLPEDHIILTVEAYEQGTHSSAITYPSPNNLANDTLAAAFTDLDAYENTADALPADGLIASDFYPAVYAYTVYVESNLDSVMLRAAFDDDGTSTYTVSLDDNGLTISDWGNYCTVEAEVDLSGVNQKTVRLKKIDNNSTLGAIVYKITFIKKGEYNLELSDPSKVYDGTQVSVTAKSVYSGTLYTIEDVLDADNSQGNTTVSTFAAISDQQLRCGSGSKSRTVTFTMTGQVLPTSQSNVLLYILYFDITKLSNDHDSIVNSDGYYVGWEVTYPEDGSTPVISRLGSAPDGFDTENATWVTAASSHQVATVNSRAVSLHFPAADTMAISYDSGQQYILFKFGAGVLSKSGSDNKTESYAEAQAALASGSPGDIFDYVVSENYEWAQTVSVGKVTTSGKGSNVNSTDILVNAPSYTKEISGYYEIVSDGGEVEYISATAEDLASAKFTFYAQAVSSADGTPQVDDDGNPVFETSGTSVLPTDAGTYRVDGELHSDTYNAYGSRVFTIEQRLVTVLQIENWLIYVTAEEAADLVGKDTLEISTPGDITIDNIVRGDDVSIVVDSVAGNVYYNDVTVTYAAQKITLVDAFLTGEDSHNYALVYNGLDSNEILVFGQIAYDMQGVIFRKTTSGNWRKYYPVDASDPVDASSADYHSPADENGVYLAHSEYVKARTVNSSSGGRYAVDIEYGAMQFTYYHGIWDVNQMVYTEDVDSHWIGMNGTNNKVTIINYSNQPVYYQVSATIDFLYAAIGDSSSGITATMATSANGTNAIGNTTWTSVNAAAPGDSSAYGTSGSSDCYLILSGIPQMQESSTYTTVGSIWVTISPVAGT